MTVYDALLPLIQLLRVLIAALTAVVILGVLGLFGFAAVMLWPEPERARTTVPLHELPTLDDIAALTDDIGPFDDAPALVDANRVHRRAHVPDRCRWCLDSDERLDALRDWTDVTTIRRRQRVIRRARFQGGAR